MTTLDRILLVMAVLQGLAIVGLVVTGLLARGTWQRSRRAARPALDGAKALSAAGKAMADRVRNDGLGAVTRVKKLGKTVKRRVETTVRIAREIKPGADTAVTDLREKRAAAADASRRLTAIARGLGRVKNAAQQAGRAARQAPGDTDPA